METDDDIEFMTMSPDDLYEVMAGLTREQQAKVEAAAKKFAWIGGNIKKNSSTPARLRVVMLSY